MGALNKSSGESKKISFCPYCGTRLDVGARFCKNCGELVDKTPERSQSKPEIPTCGNPTDRKTIYEGYIHKCPSCGEPLDAFVAVCPACGYELRGTQSVNSIKSFSVKIEQAVSDEQKVSLIRSFPIPNTKEDIFEFMILTSTNIRGEQRKKIFDAWLVKFEQSYQKAQLVIKNPSDIAHIKTIYEKTYKQVNKENLLRNARVAGNMLSKSGVLLNKILLFIGKSAAVIIGIALFIMAINIDKNGGNAAMHELIGVILLITSATTLTRRGVSLLEILIGAGSGGLSFYFANYLENGSMLQLGGAVVLIIVAVSFFKKLAKSEDK